MSAQDFKPYINLTPTAVTVSATGEITNAYTPGYPIIVRRLHITPMVSGLNYDNLNVSLMIQSLASGSTASAICTITGTATDIKGKVIVKKGLNTSVGPHQRVFLNNNAVVSGAPTIIAGLIVEPKWEEPENFSSVRVLT